MKRFLVVMLFVAMLVSVGVVFFCPHEPTRLASQKIASSLVMPCAVVWIGLLVASVWSFWCRVKAVGYFCLVMFLLQTLGTNEHISQKLAQSLEREFFHIKPLTEQHFDALVVLGGGTGEGVHGNAQLKSSGDRLALAARMFHRGLTDHIYCSGKLSGGSSDGKQDPGQQSAMILQGLGVPEDRITLADGYNTQGEMQALAKLLPAEERIGLITSAWHLNRALRLARSQQLTLEPLPGDFITTPSYAASSLSWLCTSAAGRRTARCLKEYLARCFGR